MSRLLLVAALALVLASCKERGTETDERGSDVASTQALAVDPAREEQAIAEVNRRWIEAIENKDAATIGSFFADDGIAVYDGEKLEGPEAVRRDNEEQFADSSATGTFASERIVVSEAGDMAYDFGTYNGRREGPDGPEETRGRYVTVWRKIGGEWKVVADIGSDEQRPSEVSD